VTSLGWLTINITCIRYSKGLSYYIIIFHNTDWQQKSDLRCSQQCLYAYTEANRLSLLSPLTNTLPAPSASEVTTLWRYTNLFIIISMGMIRRKISYSNSCIGKNVLFCMQRYKCNIEMVFSGQINNIVENHFNRSTNCMQAALANLLFEIIMVQDGVLSLPTWVSWDFTDDVLASVCV